MRIDLATFISSLLDDRFSIEGPQIPDGLCDLSCLVDPLVPITRRGRALSSNQEYAHATFIGELLKRLFPQDTTRDQLEDGIIALIFLFLMTVDQAVELHGDTTTEELLMMALDQDRLRALKRALAATPYTEHLDNELRPNIASLPMFADARPITDAIISGFIRRHLAPHLPTMFAEEDAPEPTTDERELPAKNFRFSELEDVPDLDNLESDSLEGWDEFHEHFWNNHYVQYEHGWDLDDILSSHEVWDESTPGWFDDERPEDDEE